MVKRKRCRQKKKPKQNEKQTKPKKTNKNNQNFHADFILQKQIFFFKFCFYVPVIGARVDEWMLITGVCLSRTE